MWNKVYDPDQEQKSKAMIWFLSKIRVILRRIDNDLYVNENSSASRNISFVAMKLQRIESPKVFFLLLAGDMASLGIVDRSRVYVRATFSIALVMSDNRGDKGPQHTCPHYTVYQCILTMYERIYIYIRVLKKKRLFFLLMVQSKLVVLHAQTILSKFGICKKNFRGRANDFYIFLLESSLHYVFFYFRNKKC